MITATANSPDRPLTVWPRSSLPKKIMPARFRFFTGRSPSRRKRQWRFPRIISKRVVWRSSIRRMRREIYQQVAEAKNPNPYREDSRMAAGTIVLARGQKAEALRKYEALANEAQKPALKAEAAVRGGMIAIDLRRPKRARSTRGWWKRRGVFCKKADATGSRKIAGDRRSWARPAAISVRPVRAR